MNLKTSFKPSIILFFSFSSAVACSTQSPPPRTNQEPGDKEESTRGRQQSKRDKGPPTTQKPLTSPPNQQQLSHQELTFQEGLNLHMYEVIMKKVRDDGWESLQTSSGEVIQSHKDLQKALLRDVNQIFFFTKKNSKSFPITMLQNACRLKNYSLLRQLLTHPSIDPNGTPSQETFAPEAPIDIAIRNRDKEGIEILLKNPKTLPPKENINRLKVKRLLGSPTSLLENLKTNTTLQYPDGTPIWENFTPLKDENPVYIEALLENPAFNIISRKQPGGRTLLVNCMLFFVNTRPYAKEWLNVILKIINSNNTKTNLDDPTDGPTPIEICVQRVLYPKEYIPIFDALLATGKVTINKSLIYSAIQNEEFYYFKKLLELTPNLENIKNKEHSLLHDIARGLAPDSTNIQKLELLLKKIQEKGDTVLRNYVNDQCDKKETALTHATATNDIPIVQKLLTIPGIDISTKNNNGEDALQIAQKNNFNEVVSLLEKFKQTHGYE